MEMYRTLFEHPLVQAITTWDFRDGAWLGAPSGYARKDNTLKPSYHMLRKLVREEWWTDTMVRTDSEGNAMIEAYKGDYCFETDGMSGKASLTDNDLSDIMVLG